MKFFSSLSLDSLESSDKDVSATLQPSHDSVTPPTLESVQLGGDGNSVFHISQKLGEFLQLSGSPSEAVG